MALVVSVSICLAVGAVSGWVTGGSVRTWYPTLNKPTWNPPDAVFAPVWTTLYAMMGVAVWLVWRQRVAERRAVLIAFALQLALNAAWSILFFGMQRPGWALVEIVALWLSIAATIVLFARVSRLAAWLLVPYQAWVTFATALNAAIWWLNRG